MEFKCEAWNEVACGKVFTYPNCFVGLNYKLRASLKNDEVKNSNHEETDVGYGCDQSRNINKL